MTLAKRTALGAGLIGLAALAFGASAMADDGDMVAATPARSSKSIEAAKAASAKEAASGAVRDYLSTVHGDVTAMVDSEGGYNVSGTAVLPLGENGTAIITLSKGEGGWWQLPPYGYGYGYDPYDVRAAGSTIRGPIPRR